MKFNNDPERLKRLADLEDECESIQVGGPLNSETIYFSPMAMRWIGTREYRLKLRPGHGWEIAIVRGGRIYDYHSVGLSYEQLVKEIDFLKSTGMHEVE